jgi:membrane-bound metal-dependent hydrolase YbcI (DUF457 family)
MANYKGHIGGAVATCMIFVLLVMLLPVAWLSKTGGILSDWQMVSGLFVVAMLFGLWPDIDTNSKAQDIFFAVAFVLDILLIATGYLEAAAYLGLLAMTPIIGKHRGWTHKKWAMIIIPLPILVVPYLYQPDNFIPGIIFYGAAVAGYFSHLLLDGLIIKNFRIKN